MPPPQDAKTPGCHIAQNFIIAAGAVKLECIKNSYANNIVINVYQIRLQYLQNRFSTHNYTVT